MTTTYVNGMRKRDNSFNAVWTDRILTHNVSSSGVVTLASDQTLIASIPTTDVMYDVVTPGFAKRMANGGIVNSPMSRVLSTLTGSDSGMSYRSANAAPYTRIDYSQLVGFSLGLPVMPQVMSDVENAKKYAMTAALAGLSSPLQGLTSIGEGRSTLSMVLGPIRALASPIKTSAAMLGNVAKLLSSGKKVVVQTTKNGHMINGRFYPRHVPKFTRARYRPVIGTQVLTAGKAVSGGVLLNNLGLRPLMMDIEAIMKTIPQSHEYERRTSRKVIHLANSKTTVTNQVFDVRSVQVTDNYVEKIKIRSTILYGDQFDILGDFGIGLFAIPSTALELIPFSFVLDYFVNVGDVLAAAEAAYRNFKIEMACTVVDIDQSLTRVLDSSAVTPPRIQERACTGTYQLTCQTKTRSPGLDIGLAYRPNPVRPSVVQNLLSLLVQSLLKIRSRTLIG